MEMTTEWIYELGKINKKSVELDKKIMEIQKTLPKYRSSIEISDDFYDFVDEDFRQALVQKVDEYNQHNIDMNEKSRQQIVDLTKQMSNYENEVKRILRIVFGEHFHWYPFEILIGEYETIVNSILITENWNRVAKILLHAANMLEDLSE